MFEKLMTINQGLNQRFPDGKDPFKIIARLAEETGELAREVNHFEKTGIKVEKYGQPDRAKMAMELKHVLLVALQVAAYYGIEAELAESIETTYQRMLSEGWLKPSE